MNIRSQKTTYKLRVGIDQADDNKPSEQKSIDSVGSSSVSVCIVYQITETFSLNYSRVITTKLNPKQSQN